MSDEELRKIIKNHIVKIWDREQVETAHLQSLRSPKRAEALTWQWLREGVADAAMQHAVQTQWREEPSQAVNMEVSLIVVPDLVAMIAAILEAAHVEMAPGRWWRVLSPEGTLWCETSDELEAKRSMTPGCVLQRGWDVVRDFHFEWRDELTAPAEES